MRVILDLEEGRKTFNVNWRHVRRDGGWNKRGKEHTICTIQELDSAGLVVNEIYHTQFCSRQDQYCRAEGRERSFAGALIAQGQRLGNSFARNHARSDVDASVRSVRKSFWDMYKRTIGIRAMQKGKR